MRTLCVVQCVALVVLACASAVSAEREGSGATPASLSGGETHPSGLSSAVLQGELGEAMSASGVYVKASLFVARTTERRFRGDMKQAFRAALASVCDVTSNDVGIDKLVPKSAPPPTSGDASRRLLQNQITEDEGVITDVSIKVKDKTAGAVAIGLLKAATVGGEESKLSTAFSQECSKHDTIDAQFQPIVTLNEEPFVSGVSTPDVGTAFQPPDWCQNYGKGKDDSLTPTWTDKQCSPTWGTFDQIVDNIPGIVCACKGLKITSLAPDPAAPDTQTVSAVRVHATNNSYSTYALEIRSGISAERPTPELGLSVTLNFGQSEFGRNDTHHRVHFSLNRVLEYMAKNGKGLAEDTTKHLNYNTKKQHLGQDCNGTDDEGQANCVLQDFYLDKLHPAVITKEGRVEVITISSDLQGSAPWCRQENGGKGCPKPPDKKPQVTFAFRFDPSNFQSVSFDVAVDTFPYKRDNSTLSLRGKVYSETLVASMSNTDSSLTQEDTLLDCTVFPLPHGCPFMRMNNGVQLSWAKTIRNVVGQVSYKVAASEPQEVSMSTSTILPVNHRESSAKAKSLFFSFVHKKAPSLTWKPTLSMRNLPVIPYNAAGRLAPHLILVVALQVAVYMCKSL